VHLTADIYRPVGPERYPVLVHAAALWAQGCVDGRSGPSAGNAAQGYVVLVQDVRGRGRMVYRRRLQNSRGRCRDGAQTLVLRPTSLVAMACVASYG